MSSAPDASDLSSPAASRTPGTMARRVPWRLRALRWHRQLALLGATALVLWGLSGLLHPLMTTFGPQQRVFYPPQAPLTVAGGPEIHAILEAAGITQARAVRLVAGPAGALLQVTTTAHAPRRYFALDTGAEQAGHDPRQAEFLARHYLALPEDAVAVETVTAIHEFSASYPPINRLLPVYRVSFATPDALIAYVHTETGALAAVDNRFKQRVQTLFQLVHTWSWIPPAAEWLRVAGIAVLLLAMLGMALSGTLMLWKMRRISHATGARRWHRSAAWILVLPALGFGLSGLYHLVQATTAPVPAGQRLSPPLATDDIAYPLRAQWTDLTRGLDIRGLSLVQDAARRLYYRLELAPDSAEPRDTDAIRNARFDGVPRTGPALYVDAASGVPWPAGDREFALQLGERFSGLPRDAVTDMAFVTRFGPAYDFRNKRLPVWRIDYGAPLETSLFVDTRSGVLADVLAHRDLPERYSFSFLHKWNFLFPLGRPLQNGAVRVAVIALVACLAGLGLRLYPAARRARRRRNNAH